MLFDYLFIIFFILILSFFIWCYEQKRKFRSSENIPGPKTYPIIGNSLEFGFNPVDQLFNIMRLSKLYEPFTKIWLGPKSLYIIATDPDFFDLIMSSPKYIKKSSEYNTLKPWLKNGLLLSYGSYWQKRRKILTPAFHFKILESFISIFNTETSILVERLSKNVGKEALDVYPYVTACTLDMISETAMGTSVKAQTTVDNEYVDAVKTYCTTSINRAFSAWKQFDMFFPLSNDYWLQQKSVKIIHSFTKSVIEQRRNKLLNKRPDEEIIDDAGMKKKQVFLDVLLSSTIDGESLSDADIQEEVDTFMFEGHDTTASLIAFAMYELARNSEVQDKMVTELKEIFGNDKNYQPTLQDLNNMKYTELVLKETMRLYPSVPYIARVLEEEICYKGTIFPKHTAILLFIYGMQRKEALFPDANKFNPERFLTKNYSDLNSFAYVPFSAGPRNCIGQKFAMQEVKCTIAKIIVNFEILPADPKYDVILSAEVVLKSANGVHVQLKHRQ